MEGAKPPVLTLPPHPAVNIWTRSLLCCSCQLSLSTLILSGAARQEWNKCFTRMLQYLQEPLRWFWAGFLAVRRVKSPYTQGTAH